jgi:hypothetical protein
MSPRKEETGTLLTKKEAEIKLQLQNFNSSIIIILCNAFLLLHDIFELHSDTFYTSDSRVL